LQGSPGEILWITHHRRRVGPHAGANLRNLVPNLVPEVRAATSGADICELAIPHRATRAELRNLVPNLVPEFGAATSERE